MPRTSLGEGPKRAPSDVHRWCDSCSPDRCTDQGYVDYESIARAEEDEQFYLETQRQRVLGSTH